MTSSILPPAPSWDVPLLLTALARHLGQKLLIHRARLATAESCTGGLIAAALTSVPGSSGWFEYGFVTYANEAKQKILGVPPTTLATHGAVSSETVLAMARGARALSGAEWSLAVSGIAGPTGGTPNKPIGTVWFAWVGPYGHEILHRSFPGDRPTIRLAAAATALSHLLDLLS
ncbi:MAG: CinA family protein [Hydrogenophilus sp.]|nr:CinA family protein [Hydrogenophilus sp.]